MRLVLGETGYLEYYGSKVGAVIRFLFDDVCILQYFVVLDADLSKMILSP